VKTVNTSGSLNASSTTLVYSTTVSGAQLAMTYTFNNAPNKVGFAGTELSIEPHSLKWSIDLVADQSSNLSSNNSQYPAGSRNFTRFSYNVSQSSSAPIDTSNLKVTAVANVPAANMTSYYLSLGQSSSSSEQQPNVIQLQVFDVALVDGDLKRIEHSVNISQNSYLLVLLMPPFNKSAFYDPVLSLGVLVQSGTTTGSSNTLLIAVAVIVPTVVVGVVAIVVVSTIGIYLQKQHSRKTLKNRLSTYTL